MNASEQTNGRTPCCRSKAEWPVCYADGCYLNYRCPVYRGKYPSPVRDYIPMPPVFLLIDTFEAVPISYHIPLPDYESDW